MCVSLPCTRISARPRISKRCSASLAAAIWAARKPHPPRISVNYWHMSASDEDHMAQALALARRGLGTTWPNPSVGCIVVQPSGEIVGRGYTAPGGRPHAEAIALERAGGRAV